MKAYVKEAPPPPPPPKVVVLELSEGEAEWLVSLVGALVGSGSGIGYGLYRELDANLPNRTKSFSDYFEIRNHSGHLSLWEKDK